MVAYSSEFVYPVFSFINFRIYYNLLLTTLRITCINRIYNKIIILKRIKLIKTKGWMNLSDV